MRRPAEHNSFVWKKGKPFYLIFMDFVLPERNSKAAENWIQFSKDHSFVVRHFPLFKIKHWYCGIEQSPSTKYTRCTQTERSLFWVWGGGRIDWDFSISAFLCKRAVLFNNSDLCIINPQQILGTLPTAVELSKCWGEKLLFFQLYPASSKWAKVMW